jgi:hypothetical protein
LLVFDGAQYHGFAMGDPDVRFRVSELEGEHLTHDAVEEDILAVRGRQRVRVEVLQDVREQQAQLRGALDQELAEMQSLSAKLRAPGAEASLWARIGERLSALFAGEPAERRSVEQLLRAQYDTSLVRLRQARELADRLEQVRTDLYDEIDQLNRRIVASARFEDESSALLLQLREERAAVQQRLEGELSKLERREQQAQADRLRREMAELSTQMQLHGTRDERLGRLKESTDLLAQTIANLASDMRRYVAAASEKLDLVANQIQAVGAAADASAVLVDLKRSLDAMTASMNDATQFVTEVQSFFHQHVDGLMSEMDVYDEVTRARLEVSQEFSQLSDERRIEEGLALAADHRARRTEPS